MFVLSFRVWLRLVSFPVFGKKKKKKCFGRLIFCEPVGVVNLYFYRNALWTLFFGMRNPFTPLCCIYEENMLGC